MSLVIKYNRKTKRFDLVNIKSLFTSVTIATDDSYTFLHYVRKEIMVKQDAEKESRK